MDPITAIGAVASVVQLAQAALSLSKTLYSLGAAVASASDDVQMLADDLKTFSQSLTLLSRLLEDSKSWYSDDVYLLTAKIIKDCADLYVKIDKVLVKLAGNGKSNWKMRVKFVYKEGQIRKLMKRLRDMKGTLATILMSLQVDLQLSLLNISSSSKIQRAPERPLQHETIQTLLDAQKMAQQTGFVSIQTNYSDHVLFSWGEGYGRNEDATRVPSSPNAGVLLRATQSNSTASNIDRHQYDASPISPQGFSVLSTHSKPPVPQEIASSSARGIEGSIPVHRFPAMNFMAHQIKDEMASVETLTTKDTELRSLKTASSLESFQSAVSEQESSIDVVNQVEAIYNVLHAFRTAFEVLESLIKSRLREKEQDTYSVARELQNSLMEGEREIRETHNRNCKLHGALYTKEFADCHTTELQNISSTLLKDIVMILHYYSAEHVKVQKVDFETLHVCSERCRVQAISQIIDVVSIVRTAKDYRPSGVTSDADESLEIVYSHATINFNANRSFEMEMGSTNETAPPSYTFARTVYNISGDDSSEEEDSLLSESKSDYQTILESTNLPAVSYPTELSMNLTPKRTSHKEMEQGRRIRRHSPPLTTPNMSNVMAPSAQFNIPEYTVPGAYFSPLSSPALHAQNEQSLAYDQKHSNAANSPVDMNLESYSAPASPVIPKEPSRQAVLKSRSIRRKVQQSPIKSQEGEAAPVIVDHSKPGTPMRGMIRASREEVPGDPVPEPSITIVEIMQQKDPAPPTGGWNPSRRSAGEEVQGESPEQWTGIKRRGTRQASVEAPPSKLSRTDAGRGGRGGRGGYRGRGYRGIAQLEHASTEHTIVIDPKPIAQILREDREAMANLNDPALIDPDSISYSPTSSLHTKPLSSGGEITLLHRRPQGAFKKIWWEAYCRLNTSQMTAIISDSLRQKLGAVPFNTSDEELSESVGSLVKKIDTEKNLEESSDLKDLIRHRDNIIKVILTISSHLGLVRPIIGWSCVVTFLAMYEDVFELVHTTNPEINAAEIEQMRNSFQQVDDLVGLLARYAVMENLFHQSPTLTLTDEYRNALLDLCVAILTYFAHAFTGAQTHLKDPKDEKVTVIESSKICEDLIDEIKVKDKACQGFRVVVEVEEESDSEIEDVEMEDVSDVSDVSGESQEGIPCNEVSAAIVPTAVPQF